MNTTVFFNTLKRIFKSPLNIAFLFVFPLLMFFLTSASAQNSESAGASETPLSAIEFKVFGVADEDNSLLSKALIKRLETRFELKSIEKDEVTNALISQEIPWVLIIPKNFESDLLNGEIPNLESASLSLSATASLGKINAESIIKSLAILKTEDEELLNEWAEQSKVEVFTNEAPDDWEQIAFWLGFFGFISMFTAYFVSKALVDDKLGGMPERIGAAPNSPRKHLISGVLAAFVATEISVIALLGVIVYVLGAVENLILLFLILSLYNLFAVALVFAVACIAKDLGAVSVIVMLTATIIAMLGGTFWPIEIAPDYMQKLAKLSPGYWLSKGITDLREASFSGFGTSALFLIGFALVAVLLGGWKSVQKMDD